ncbi:Chain length determinant protein [Bacteroides salyersiae]|uniref:GumC family protein n=1 Tax=Bacteroides salyersiae TaxID=291644 RepID=UPI001B8BD5D0|nr:tyrosine-protein kinase [Bacteroides salyersiae]QUT75396.1 Chain length determinant protein [Bacteroides salyersiae]
MRLLTEEELDGMVDNSNELKRILSDYLSYWKWFILSVVLCVVGGRIYLHYATPVYRVSTTIMINDERQNGNNEAMMALTDIGYLSSTKNIGSEMELLRSRTIVEQVVKEMKLYITYQVEDNFAMRDLYVSSPVCVEMKETDLENLSYGFNFNVVQESDKVLQISGIIAGQDITQRITRLPTIIETPLGELTVSLRPNVRPLYGQNIMVTVVPPLRTAINYSTGLGLAVSELSNSIITVSKNSTLPQRDKVFLDKLIDAYNRDANEDKKSVATRTAEFINDRIAIINEELGSTEEKLENFKRQSGLMNMSDAQVYVQGSSEYEKKRSEVGTQLSLMEYLKDYVNSPAHQDDVIPANIGVTDVTLSALINKYNESVLQRNRLLRSSPATNPVIVRLNNNLTAMRENITSTINSVYNGLMISKQDIDRQMRKYTSRVNSAPTQERTFTNISRQQELKSSLYLLLLKKREENSIALAATADKAKVIDSAVVSGPISPNYSLIRSLSVAVGLLLPIVVITLINFFRYRIEGHADVEKLARVPILGDIPLERSLKKSKTSLIVQEGENANALMTEVFCGLRTNLQFLLGKANHNVILVTFTISGEGKTFVVTNLAVSLALLDKRVVVGLDIRRPKLLECFGFSYEEIKGQKGITNYLSDNSIDLHSLLISAKNNSNLYILPAGTIPPNPAELIARPALDTAIKLLAEEFDYVILDSAPVGLVSDALIASRLADITLYICRADYSHKSDFDLINDLKKKQKLPEMAIIVNGINMKKKKYGYYYGYGQRDYRGYYSKSR